jgi:hypothetical protein
LKQGSEAAVAISPQFIQDSTEVLQRVSLVKERAAELAIEVERLNDAVRQASLALDFDAEPAAFFAVLTTKGEGQ